MISETMSILEAFNQEMECRGNAFHRLPTATLKKASQLLPYFYSDDDLALFLAETEDDGILSLENPLTIISMVSSLALLEHDTVLQIGVGATGFRTALLAMLGQYVYVLDRDRHRLERLYQILSKLALVNRNRVALIHGEPELGHPLENDTTYRRIIINEALSAHPTSQLLFQLDRHGGRMVFPIGSAYDKARQSVLCKVVTVERLCESFNEKQVSTSEEIFLANPLVGKQPYAWQRRFRGDYIAADIGPLELAYWL